MVWGLVGICGVNHGNIWPNVVMTQCQPDYIESLGLQFCYYWVQDTIICSINIVGHMPFYAGRFG